MKHERGRERLMKSIRRHEERMKTYCRDFNKAERLIHDFKNTVMQLQETQLETRKRQRKVDEDEAEEQQIIKRTRTAEREKHKIRQEFQNNQS